MRSTYLAVVGTITATVAAILIWQHRDQIRDRVSINADKAKSATRSVWGRVRKAADNLTHTERDNQSSPV